MNHELDPKLRADAEKILETKSKFIGEAYWRSETKRALDLLIAGPSSLITLPVITLAGLAIFADDGHWPFVNVPVEHPGQREHVPFYKLRTMIPNAQTYELDMTVKEPLRELKRKGKDQRLARPGPFLRKTSLDELPQLFNVMIGDLSLVGPRPPQHSEWRHEIYPHQDEEPYRGFIDLLKKGIKYGVTGFYGILGRSDLEMTDRLRLEILYGERASFKADLRIIAMTIPALLSRKGAF